MRLPPADGFRVDAMPFLRLSLVGAMRSASGVPLRAWFSLLSRLVLQP